MSVIVDNKVQTKAAFQLKGGLYHFMTLRLLTTDLAIFEEQLAEQIAQAPNFFRNASVVIDLQQISSDSQIYKDNRINNQPIDLTAIAILLRKKGLFPIGITHATEEQRTQASKAGLASLYNNGNNSRQSNTTTQKSTHSKSENTNTSMQASVTKRETTGSVQNPTSTFGSKLITYPVRSGQQIYAAESDLIITAAVSNGAEVLADGNIHIYGCLRGRALAGINGNQEARIFCQSLEAELISIAGQYKISEDFSREYWKAAVEISLKEGRLQIRAL